MVNHRGKLTQLVSTEDLTEGVAYELRIQRVGHIKSRGKGTSKGKACLKFWALEKARDI